MDTLRVALFLLWPALAQAEGVVAASRAAPVVDPCPKQAKQGWTQLADGPVSEVGWPNARIDGSTVWLSTGQRFDLCRGTWKKDTAPVALTKDRVHVGAGEMFPGHEPSISSYDVHASSRFRQNG